MNEGDLLKKIHELQTDVLINEDCFNSIKRQVEELIINEVGIISFVLGDEENEWEQIVFKILHTDFTENEQIRKKEKLSDGSMINKSTITVMDEDDIFFVDEESRVKEEKKQQKLAKEERKQKRSCKLYYLTIDSSILKHQKDFFVLIKSQLEQQQFLNEELRNMPIQFTSFINWIKEIDFVRIVLIITNTSKLLKNNIELFYEITDAFLTLLDNNHLTVIFTALSDDIFADKKISSRITFGRDPLILKGISSPKEMKSFLLKTTSISSNECWNTFTQSIFNDKDINDLFQLCITINPIRNIAIHLLQINQFKLIHSDTSFISFKILTLLYPQPIWNLTPYQYIVLIGLNRLSQISSSPIILVSDLCDFLFKNTKNINSLQNVKQSFYSLKDYHYQILLELQTIGLVTINVKKSIVNLEITQLTINDITASLKSNPLFKELIDWNNSLNLVFQK
ncbi:hypothetical protein ENUP19_0265G0022 [Entamoeba nuttalli]|uniref:Origin recognition complex subunit n=2 Tax=Entamoeba nuttalli TaxID=412467 RepID=K2G3T7_ENTNP|nr:hypothetical protein ENU1_213620 [Entamoeba nuttalli P19]EKE36961.1 hypothetical protein ENU1_213620 [Entamoeba nuttalli P19]|eukprot:XP_008860701.1 hypothetical protein ENU1_213620 [Entamoeba nuttalli P19]